MQRAFEADVLACPRCPGRMVLLATIEDPAVIRRILTHLGLPLDGDAPEPAHPPPQDEDTRDAEPPLPPGTGDSTSAGPGCAWEGSLRPRQRPLRRVLTARSPALYASR